jgi:NAD(P)-dependent dehydrogenase (short-subunit alcohol dehydrogenase family)
MTPNPKKILVTGAAKRIGAELVRALAEDGWHVVLHYNRQQEPAEALAEEMRAKNIEIELVRADLSQADGASKLLSIATKTGPLTALINNASLFSYDCAQTVSADLIHQHMAVNLTAPALLTYGLYQQLPKDSKGCVINMLDAKLFGINPDYFSYTLSKAALLNLTHISAQAYAPQLRVNGIAPGIVLPSGGQSQAEFEASHKRNLLGQGALVPEIVATMRLLLCASSMTGEVVILDGGAHLCPPARDVAFLEV